MKSTFDPYCEDWGFFAGSVCPGHRNPYRVASPGRAVHLWGSPENAAGNRVACLLSRLDASNPLVAVAVIFSEDLSGTLMTEMVDEIVHRVSERMCPHLVGCRNRLEVVARAGQMLYGHGRSVLAGGEVSVFRRRACRSQVLEVN